MDDLSSIGECSFKELFLNGNAFQTNFAINADVGSSQWVLEKSMWQVS